ncbi:hypothetical protein E2320_019352 [Naja naja]|nr:hypothetical protein E2320_019352 [Naja naja]
MDTANLTDIPANRKKAYFLSFCGALLAPQTVKAVMWEELQEVLSNHYTPKLSRIARRHTFRRRNQAEGETIKAKADLNLKAAIKEAQAMEMSMFSMAEIQGSSSYLSGRTSVAIHYKEAVNAEFYEEEEKEVNHLKGPQLARRTST